MKSTLANSLQEENDWDSDPTKSIEPKLEIIPRKLCAGRCGQVLCSSKFYVKETSSKGKVRLDNKCKDCRNEGYRKRYWEFKKEKIKKQKDHREAICTLDIEYDEFQKISNCDSNLDIEQYDFSFSEEIYV